MTIMTMNNDTTILESNKNGCGVGPQVTYDSMFGFSLAMPEWEAIFTAVLLSFITLITIVGNILVILSVFTYKPLRIVQNFFIVSLAVADLTVAILVLPLNVAYYVRGSWDFGIHVCKMWLTSDVLCCTASILHLCVIAMDRFWAITDPINYAQKRNVERVLFLIAGVWILSFIISSPPLLGWNDWPSEFHSDTPCELTSQRGYVVYSSLGSFFIPLIIMTIVYIEIFVATRRRLRERAQATRMNALTMKSQMTTQNTKVAIDATTQQHISGGSGDRERESISSDVNNHNEDQKSTFTEDSKALLKRFKLKRKKKRTKDSTKDSKNKQKSKMLICDENSVNDVQENDDDDDNNLNDMRKPSENKNGSTEMEENNGTTTKNEDENVTIKMTNNSTSVIETDKKCVLLATSNQNNCQKKATGVNQFIEEKQKISLTRERRAARTLGIIMGEYFFSINFFLLSFLFC